MILRINSSCKSTLSGDLFVVVKDIIKPQLDEDGITTIGLFDFLDDMNGLEL